MTKKSSLGQNKFKFLLQSQNKAIQFKIWIL